MYRLTTLVQFALHGVTTVFALVLAFARVTRQRTLGAHMHVALGGAAAVFLILFGCGVAWSREARNVANARHAAHLPQHNFAHFDVLQAATSNRRAVVQIKLLQ